MLLLAEDAAVPDLLAARASTIRGVAAVGAGFCVFWWFDYGSRRRRRWRWRRAALQLQRRQDDLELLLFHNLLLHTCLGDPEAVPTGPRAVRGCRMGVGTLHHEDCDARRVAPVRRGHQSRLAVRRPLVGMDPVINQRRDDLGMVFGVRVAAASSLIEGKPTDYISRARVRAVAE